MHRRQQRQEARAKARARTSTAQVSRYVVVEHNDDPLPIQARRAARATDRKVAIARPTRKASGRIVLAGRKNRSDARPASSERARRIRRNRRAIRRARAAA